MNVWQLITELSAFTPDAEVTIGDAEREPLSPVERVPIVAVRCDEPNRALVHVELIAGPSLREQEENRQRDERGERDS